MSKFFLYFFLKVVRICILSLDYHIFASTFDVGRFSNNQFHINALRFSSGWEAHRRELYEPFQGIVLHIRGVRVQKIAYFWPFNNNALQTTWVL